MRKIALVVGTLGVAAALTAAPAAADIVKCQQGIDKNGQKLQAAILKAFTKCKDGYRKANGDPILLSTAATSCQAGLNKALDFGNDAVIISAMEKTKSALDKLTALVPPTCEDADLSALGYLTTSLFGDRWERLILLDGLKGAYETQQVLIGDFANIMQTLGDNGCALCGVLSTPPCVNTVCTLSLTSGAETKILNFPFLVPLAGSTVIAGCEWQKVLNDPANNYNEIGLIGTPNIALKPSLILDVAGPDADTYACNLSLRTLGLLTCAGASDAPKISYTTCQDSVVGFPGDPSGVANECLPAGTCQPDPDPTTGGSCATFTPSAAAEGDTFVISTTRLRISSNDGPDNIRCNGDDTITNTAPAPIPITTGTVSSEMKDYGSPTCDGGTRIFLGCTVDDTNPITGCPGATCPGCCDVLGLSVTQGPISGAVGPNCAQARVGNNTGRTLVGAFPAAEAVPPPPGSLGDTVTKLTIVCS